MMVKTSMRMRVCSLLLAVFITMGTVPVYSETGELFGGTQQDAAGYDGGAGSSGGESAEPSAPSGDATGSGEEPSVPSGGETEPSEGGNGEHPEEPSTNEGEQPGDLTGPGTGGADGNGATPGDEEGKEEGEEGSAGNGGNPGHTGEEDEQSDGQRVVVAFPGLSDGTRRIEAPFGTPEQELGLPETLPVEYIEDESGAAQTDEVDVIWTCADYDPQTAGSYRFQAELPSGWMLNTGLSAPTVTVVLLAGEGEPAARVILAFPEYDGETPEVVTPLGTPFEELPLPSTVEAQYRPKDQPDAPEQTGRAAVRWEPEEEYTLETPGSYTFRAALAEEDGWELADGVEPPVFAVRLAGGMMMARAGTRIKVTVGATETFCDTFDEAIIFVNASGASAEIVFLESGNYSSSTPLEYDVKLEKGPGVTGEVVVDVDASTGWLKGHTIAVAVDGITLNAIDNYSEYGDVTLHVLGETSIRFGASDFGTLGIGRLILQADVHVNGNLYADDLRVLDGLVTMYYRGAINDLETAGYWIRVNTVPNPDTWTGNGRLRFDLESHSGVYENDSVDLLNVTVLMNANESWLETIAGKLVLGSAFHRSMVPRVQKYNSGSNTYYRIYPHLFGVKVEWRDAQGNPDYEYYEHFDGPGNSSGPDTGSAVHAVNTLPDGSRDIVMNLRIDEFVEVKHLPDREVTIRTDPDLDVKPGVEDYRKEFGADGGAFTLNQNLTLENIQIVKGTASKSVMQLGDWSLTIGENVSFENAEIVGDAPSKLMVATASGSIVEQIELASIRTGTLTLREGASVLVTGQIESGPQSVRTDFGVMLEADAALEAAGGGISADAGSGTANLTGITLEPDAALKVEGAVSADSMELKEGAALESKAQVTVVNHLALTGGAITAKQVSTLTLSSEDGEIHYREEGNQPVVNDKPILAIRTDAGSIDTIESLAICAPASLADAFGEDDAIIGIQGVIVDVDDVVTLEVDDVFYKFLLVKNQGNYELVAVKATVHHGSDLNKYSTYAAAIEAIDAGAQSGKWTTPLVLHLWESTTDGSGNNPFTVLPGYQTTIIGLPLDKDGNVPSGAPPRTLQTAMGQSFTLRADTAVQSVVLDVAETSWNTAGHTLTLATDTTLSNNWHEVTGDGGLVINATGTPLAFQKIDRLQRLDVTGNNVTVSGAIVGTGTTGSAFSASSGEVTAASVGGFASVRLDAAALTAPTLSGTGADSGLSAVGGSTITAGVQVSGFEAVSLTDSQIYTPSLTGTGTDVAILNAGGGTIRNSADPTDPTGAITGFATVDLSADSNLHAQAVTGVRSLTVGASTVTVSAQITGAGAAAAFTATGNSTVTVGTQVSGFEAVSLTNSRLYTPSLIGTGAATLTASGGTIQKSADPIDPADPTEAITGFATVDLSAASKLTAESVVGVHTLTVGASAVTISTQITGDGPDAVFTATDGSTITAGAQVMDFETVSLTGSRLHTPSLTGIGTGALNLSGATLSANAPDDPTGAVTGFASVHLSNGGAVYAQSLAGSVELSNSNSLLQITDAITGFPTVQVTNSGRLSAQSITAAGQTASLTSNASTVELTGAINGFRQVTVAGGGSVSAYALTGARALIVGDATGSGELTVTQAIGHADGLSLTMNRGVVTTPRIVGLTFLNTQGASNENILRFTASSADDANLVFATGVAGAFDVQLQNTQDPTEPAIGDRVIQYSSGQGLAGNQTIALGTDYGNYSLRGVTADGYHFYILSDAVKDVMIEVFPADGNATITSIKYGQPFDVVATLLAESGQPMYDRIGQKVTLTMTDGNNVKVLDGVEATVGDNGIAKHTVTPGATTRINVQAYQISGTFEEQGNTASSATPYDLAVTPKEITNITVHNLQNYRNDDKVYDATTDLPPQAEEEILAHFRPDGLVDYDENLVPVTGGVAFADKHAGVAKQVTVTGVALAGDLAGNYTLTAQDWSQPLVTGMTVRPYPLEITRQSPVEKVYDTTTALPPITYGPGQHFTDDRPFVETTLFSMKPGAGSRYDVADAGTRNVTILWELDAAPADVDEIKNNYTLPSQPVAYSGGGVITPLKVELSTVTVGGELAKDYDATPNVRQDQLGWIEAALAVPQGNDPAGFPIEVEARAKAATYHDGSSDQTNANWDIRADNFLAGAGYYGLHVSEFELVDPEDGKDRTGNYTLVGTASALIPAATARGVIRQIENTTQTLAIPIAQTELGEPDTQRILSEYAFFSPKNENGQTFDAGRYQFSDVVWTAGFDAMFNNFTLDTDRVTARFQTHKPLAEGTEATAQMTMSSTNYASQTVTLHFVVTDRAVIPGADFDVSLGADRFVYGEIPQGADPASYLDPSPFVYPKGSGKELKLVLEVSPSTVRDAGAYEVRVSIDPGEEYFAQKTLTFQIQPKELEISTDPAIHQTYFQTEFLDVDALWGGWNGLQFRDTDGNFYDRLNDVLEYDDKQADYAAPAVVYTDGSTPHTGRIGDRMPVLVREDAVPGTLFADGNYSVTVRTGPADNSSVTVRQLDLSGEDLEQWLTFDPDAHNANGWYNRQVEVALQSGGRPDQFPMFDTVGYTIPGEPEKTGAAGTPVTLIADAGDGAYHPVEVFLASSQDAGLRSAPVLLPHIGIPGSTQQGIYRIDTQPPVIHSVQVVQMLEDGGRVTVHLSDETSGMDDDSITLRFGSGEARRMTKLGDGVYGYDFTLADTGAAFGDVFQVTVNVADLAGNAAVETKSGKFYDPGIVAENGLQLYYEDGNGARHSAVDEQIILSASRTGINLVAVVEFAADLDPQELAEILADFGSTLRFHWTIDQDDREPFALQEHAYFQVAEYGQRAQVVLQLPALEELIYSADLTVALAGNRVGTSLYYATEVEPGPEVPGITDPGDRDVLLIVLPLPAEKQAIMAGLMAKYVFTRKNPNWETERSQWMDLYLVYADEYRNGIWNPIEVTQSLTARMPYPADVDPSTQDVYLFHQLRDNVESLPIRTVTHDGQRGYEFTVNSLSPFSLVWLEREYKPWTPSRRGRSSNWRPGQPGAWNYDDYWAGVIQAIQSAEPGGSVRADTPAFILTMPTTVLEALQGKDVTLYITWAGDPFCIYGGNIMSIPQNVIFLYLQDLIGMYGCTGAAPPPDEEELYGSIDNPNMGGDDDIVVYNARGERVASLPAVSAKADLLNRTLWVLDDAGLPDPGLPDVLDLQAGGTQTAGAATARTRGGWQTRSVLLLMAVFAAAVWIRYGRPEESVVTASLTGTGSTQLPAEPPMPLAEDDAGRPRRAASAPPDRQDAVAEPTPATVSPRVSALLQSDAPPKRSREDVSYYNIIEGHRLLEQQLQDGIITAEECRMLKRRLTIHS